MLIAEHSASTLVNTMDDSGFLAECAERRGMTLQEFLDFDDGFDDEPRITG